MAAPSISRDRRGSISLLVAIAAPALLLLLGLAVDVSYWAATRAELQQLADMAALAGATKYASTIDPSSALVSAANTAELNGLPVGTKTWSGTTSLTDNYGAYTATLTYQASGMVDVSVTRSLPRFFSGMVLHTAPSETATAVAQAKPRTAGAHACVLGLSGISNGVTTSDDITVSGGHSTDVGLTGCDLRSDGSIQFNGNPQLGVPQIVASGSISGSFNSTCSGSACNQEIPSQPQVPDPFASTYASSLNISGTAYSQPVSTTLNPPVNGYYTSLSFGSANYNLNPGVYYVSGSVSFSGNGTITGTGVTIVFGGGLTMNGSSTVNLSAPMSGATAGLVLASAGTSSIIFNGDSTISLSGALYFPNASVTVSGNATPSSSCTVVVAQTVTFSGSSDFADSGCSSLGIPTIYDLPGNVALMQ